MTPNEKAAHFIGWKYDHDAPWIRANGEEFRNRVDKDACPCPDMSKPEHCWLLVEALLTRDVDLVFSSDPKGTDIAYVSIDTSMFLNDVEIFHRDGNWRERLIKAAANLYDAEHPETAEAKP